LNDDLRFRTIVSNDTQFLEVNQSPDLLTLNVISSRLNIFASPRDYPPNTWTKVDNFTLTQNIGPRYQFDAGTQEVSGSSGGTLVLVRWSVSYLGISSSASGLYAAVRWTSNGDIKSHQIVPLIPDISYRDTLQRLEYSMYIRISAGINNGFIEVWHNKSTDLEFGAFGLTVISDRTLG